MIQLDEFHLTPEEDYEFQYYEGLGLLSGFDSLLRQTVLIAFGVGLLVSGILTLINYQPVRKLLHLSGKARSAGNNEYALLYEHMRESESRRMCGN